MQLSRFLFLIVSSFLPLCLLSTTWLYLYPQFHHCAFPVPKASPTTSTSTTPDLPTRAPFRLLALGDPQLEGDSSLPDPDARVFPSLEYLVSDLRSVGSWSRRLDLCWSAVRNAAKKDLPKLLEGYRKRLDLWGNDYYLAHIVRQLGWWTQPTHVAVLGDLIGSQWVSNEEFERRANRYWNTVFRGMGKVEEEFMNDNEEESRKWGGKLEVLGKDENWARRVINIVGNHDVGYAGDLDENRMTRFERAFGKANWDIWFELPSAAGNATEAAEEDETAQQNPIPALRLVVLNSMNLDTPALSASLQQETYEYINHVITTSRSVTDKTHATILLTHIPLHKEEGICVDSPFFDFFDDDVGVREQNMLSEHASKIVLENIFGMSGNPYADGGGFGRKGVVINGHDHEGCDTVHYISRNSYSSPHSIIPPPQTPDVSYTSEANVTEESSSSVDSQPEASESSEPPEQPEASEESEPSEPSWRALRHAHAPTAPFIECSTRSDEGSCNSTTQIPSMREITLRSMMGDFSGYAGFLSAWFDTSLGEAGEWRLEFSDCGVGVQHWWWVVHITDVVFGVIFLVGVVVRFVEGVLERRSGAGRILRRAEGGLGSRSERVLDTKGYDGKNGSVVTRNNAKS